jgi:hypothetical protein
MVNRERVSIAASGKDVKGEQMSEEFKGLMRRRKEQGVKAALQRRAVVVFSG